MVKTSPDIEDGAATGCQSIVDPTLADWDGDGDVDAFYVCEGRELPGERQQHLLAGLVVRGRAGLLAPRRLRVDRRRRPGWPARLRRPADRQVRRRRGPDRPGRRPASPRRASSSTSRTTATSTCSGSPARPIATTPPARSQPLPSRFPPPPPGAFSFARTNAIGDFTGDGKRDELVMLMQTLGPFDVIYAGASLLADPGSGQLVDLGLVIPNTTHPGFDPYDGIPRPGVDLDLDGDLDFAVSDGVLRNDGGGLQWTYVSGLFASTDVVDVGDFDGDGRIDLLSRTDDAVTATRTLHRNLTVGGAFQFRHPGRRLPAGRAARPPRALPRPRRRRRPRHRRAGAGLDDRAVRGGERRGSALGGGPVRAPS